MTELVSIHSPDDVRLAPFAAVADPQRIRSQGLFVAEGRRVVEGLLTSDPQALRGLLLTRSAYAALASQLEHVPDEVAVLVVDGPAVLRDVTGYRFHQGCLALAALPAPRRLAEVVPDAAAPAVVVVLEGVTNPDNVGTIFRSACAFGAAAIVLGPGCAHPLYRKALRTSLGTALALPFVEASAWPRELEELHTLGFSSLALTPAPDAVPLDDALEQPCFERTALLLGSEERGLSEAALALAAVSACIVQEPGIDSLNVAAAAAIALQRLHARHSLREDA